MAVDFRTLKKTKRVDPPRCLIYGPPGQGKTSLAASFPAPIIIDVEQGVPADIEIHSFGEVAGYDAVIEAIGQLATEDHDFSTVIIDSLDKLEPLVWAKVCADNNWKSVEDPGYGKGYVLADSYWQHLFDGLNHLNRVRGMAIVLIAHSEVSRFDDPTTGPYSKYDIRLHKRALAMVEDGVDAIFFVNQKPTMKKDDVGFNKTVTHAEGGGQRWIHCEGRPAYTAKNRYGMPDTILYPKGQGFSVLAPYFPAGASAPAEAA